MRIPSGEQAGGGGAVLVAGVDGAGSLARPDALSGAGVGAQATSATTLASAPIRAAVRIRRSWQLSAAPWRPAGVSLGRAW